MATEHTPTAMVAVDRFGYLTTGNLLIDRQAKRLINTLVEEKFRNEVDAWVAADIGRVPTRLAIRFELAREPETLCAALGPWALVDSNERRVLGAVRHTGSAPRRVQRALPAGPLRHSGGAPSLAIT